MLQIDEYSETQAAKFNLISTKYNGKNFQIKGKTGEAYLNVQDNQWFFTVNRKDFYRVNGKNLSCNNEKGQLKCTYEGLNNLIKGKKGKAHFDEEVDSWIFKAQGSKEEFRVGEHNLKFVRDADVDNF